MAAGRYASLLALVLLALAPAAGADEVIPRTFEFDHLSDNGRSFITSEASVPLRCLDLPGLLFLSKQEQDATLDKAVDAGFNAISFEAPLYGPQGLAKTLGTVDAAQASALSRLLQSMGKHRVYAFPVLWTPAAVEALIGPSAARSSFWGGKNSLGWQAWATRQLAAQSLEGEALTATAAVGGWLLYRGPWPGGEPKQGAAPEAVTPSTEAWMRSWAQWQVKLFRKAGFSQRLGLGLWPKQDLAASVDGRAAVPAPGGDAVEAPGPEEGGAPFAPLSGGDQDSGGKSTRVLDVLPAVPEAGQIHDHEGAVEEATGTAAAVTPWDLEGLDWDRIDSFLAGAPLGTQVDFIEFSLETEDWYRVGERLAEAALKTEVPVIWRQDWRTASRYERGKRLEPPAPLAGLAGPWPDEDWPGEGESIWPALGHELAPVPFQIREVQLTRKGKQVLALVELNKPAALTVHWGQRPPLDHEWHSSGRAKTAYALPLAGAAGEPWVLLQVTAKSPSAGTAIARTRWLKVPK
jgi:hypothetical protein